MTRPVPFRSLLAAQVRKTASAAIAMLVAALALFAASAHAATASATFYLGPTGSGTQISTGGEIVWLAPGALPAGSILKSVSIEVTLEDASGGTWASDLNFKAGGLLQIGSDGGSPDWANGQDGTIGAMVVDIKNAPADFPDTIDLNATGASLKNAWDTATWSGTVTITYDAPQATTSNTYFLGTAGNGTFFEGDTFTQWSLIGPVPAGTYLRSVSINATIESTDQNNWASELMFLAEPASGTPGDGAGILEIGPDWGADPSNGATTRLFWPASANTDPVSTVTDTKTAGIDFPDTIDLSTTSLFLMNAYLDHPGGGGTWSGTVTVRYAVNAPTLTWTGTDPTSPTHWSTAPGVLNWDGGAGSVAYTNGNQALFSDSGLAGSPTVNIFAGDVTSQKVTFNHTAGTYTLTGAFAITGDSALVKEGGGLLVIENANTYTSYTRISAGTLQLGNAAALPHGAGKSVLVVDGTGSLDLGGFDTTLNGLVGSGTVTNSSAAGVILTVGDGSKDSSFSGVIEDGAGSVGLTKIGPGSLALTGDSTYTEKTSIQAGTLIVNAPLTNAGSPSPVGQSATIELFTGVSYICDEGGPSHHQESWSTNRTIDLAGPGSGTVAIRVNGNDTTFAFGAVTATGTGAKMLTLYTGFYGNGDREVMTFNGAISDSSDAATSLDVHFNTQSASVSTVNLNGANSFTGSITTEMIYGGSTGTLKIGGSLAGGAYGGAISLGSNTVLNYASPAPQTLSGAITGGGALIVSNPGSVLTLTGASLYGGGTAVTAGKLFVSNASGSGTGSGPVSVSSGATLGGTGYIAGNVTYSAGARAQLSDGAPLTFGGSLALNANVVHVALGVNVPDGDYIIATCDGSITGAFAVNAVIDSGNTLVPGHVATISVVGSDVIMTIAEAAPPPPGPPVAGYVRWFDASQIVAGNGAPVTQWDDLSANSAHATVPGGNAAPVYVADAGMTSGLGAVYFAGNGGAGDSAALGFARVGNIRTVFSVFKGNSFLLTDADEFHFHRPGDGNPADPLWDSGWSSSDIRNGSTYVNGALVDWTTFNMPTAAENGFNLVEVLTTGNVQADSFNKDRVYHSGDQYQAEVIIYDRVLTELERLDVENYLMNKWFEPATPQAKITSFGPGAVIGPLSGNAADIAWTVPNGTDVTTLMSSFTLSPGATCTVGGSPVNSGDPFDFTNPVEFTVTSSDMAITNVYTVTVTVAGPVDAGTSTVAASLPELWADGFDYSTITVTLRNALGDPIVGKDVELASSRGATDTVTGSPGVSDVNGKVTFTVKSSTVGSSVYTATDTTDSVTLTQTVTIAYVPDPTPVTTYVAGANVAQTYDFHNSSDQGWSLIRNASLTDAGVKMGGVIEGNADHGAWVGMLSHSAPAGLSIADFGIEIKFNAPNMDNPTDALELLTVRSTQEDPAEGFGISGDGGGGSMRTRERHTGTDASWGNSDDLVGCHTLTLVRSGTTVTTYLDGVVVNTRIGTADPTTPLGSIGLGLNEFDGNQYWPIGAIVSRITAFTTGAATYALTYNGNGNTGGTAPTDVLSPYPSGSTVIVLGNTGTLVKTGYNFAGWNTQADGGGTNYAPAATFNIAAATTLYAKWTLAGTAYDTWAGVNGLTGANNGRTQDPDGDGVANGLEFYLDGNPLGGEAVNVTPSLDGGNFHVHFTRRQDATAELDITHETSTTCLDGTWSPIVDDGGVTTTIQVTDNFDGTDDVDIYIVRGTDQQRFVRLRLTIP